MNTPVMPTFIETNLDDIAEFNGKVAVFMSPTGHIDLGARRVNKLMKRSLTRFAENKLFQKLEAELSALGPLEEQIATNFEFALKQASDEQLAEFVNADPRIARIEYFLRDRRRAAEWRWRFRGDLCSGRPVGACGS